ncbi:MAG: hypothetical protein KGH72_01190 [Candidatus Micrarchaeota archaeon]|nr:hypothetical protein [Candidatus Micrarchaeota archaeon]
MIGSANSKNRVKIRLTEERWFHITESHDELTGLSFDVLDSIENPDVIVKGIAGELIACTRIGNKYLISVYKETNNDGFVITAYLTKSIKKLLKRGILWKKK